MSGDMLTDIRAALEVLFGPNDAQVPRATRRSAEKTLLQLRKADAAEALNVCVNLLAEPGSHSALFAAQTVAFLCRNREPAAGWADAVLGLLRSAVDAGHVKAVHTQLSIAACALVARLKAWPAATLIPSVLSGVGAIAGVALPAPHTRAVLDLFTLLPEELENEQLAVPEWVLDECRGDLMSSAAASLVGFAAPLLTTEHATAALRCLAVWTKGGLLPWEALAPALPAALEATTAALVVARFEDASAQRRLEQLQAGCDVLTAAAAADFEAERADLFIEAVLRLRQSFEEVAREAEGAGQRAGASAEMGVQATIALATLYAEVGASYSAAVAKHPGLLQLLLATVSHPEPRVVLPVVGFWSRAGSAVLTAHAAATQPLLAALMVAAQYPPNMDDRADLDDGFLDAKLELRAAVHTTVRTTLLGVEAGHDEAGAPGTDGAPTRVPSISSALLEATGWLLCSARDDAAALTSHKRHLTDDAATQPAGELGLSRRLEATLHVLIALVPGFARAGAYTVLTSQALAELLCKLPSLPDGRAGPALWRSAAVCAGEVAMALDTALPPPLLHACAYAVTRSLAFQEAQEADGEDDAFTVLEDGHALHAGVSALWRWCSHGSSGAAQLAALPTLFETVGSAYERSMQRDEGHGGTLATGTLATAKATKLLQVLSTLAAATQPTEAAHARVELLCAPMVAALRRVAAAAAAGSAGGAAAAEPSVAALAFEQLSTVARYAGRVAPGLLATLSADWATLRAVALGLVSQPSVLHAACALLADTLRCAHGAGTPAFVEAAGQLALELMRANGFGGKAPPAVLMPLAAAIERTYASAAEGAAASQAAVGVGGLPTSVHVHSVHVHSVAQPPPPAALVEPALETALLVWLERALGVFVPRLTAPSGPSGEGSDVSPLDLTDDDGDEVVEHTCGVLSACVTSGQSRLIEQAAALALPLLCGPGLKVGEQRAGTAALRLAAQLYASPSPTVVRMLGQEGYGVALTLSLLNGAGGALPSYLQDSIAAAARTMYTAPPSRDAAAGWVLAAVRSPSFSHARVTGPTHSEEPTGGSKAKSVSNYAMVLSYLAENGAWEPFGTVLERGVAVSEVEDQ